MIDLPLSLSPERASKITVAEASGAAVLLLLGAALRFWNPGSLGIDHYDEGVYVISALGLGDPSLPVFPDQMFFSPPLYFVLVFLGQAVSGAPLDQAAVLVSALLGSLTVPLMWWVGRRWFGPGAGLAASALLALSDFHIALSRSALTDVTFAFFFLLAAGLFVLARSRRSFALAALAGVCAGLAWNTKYHGWLVLVLAAAASAPIPWRRGEGRLKRALLSWGVMSAVALVLYVPWAAYVQSLPGGYARLTEYQEILIESDWISNLRTQAQRQAYLDGPATDCAPLAGASAALLPAAAGVGLGVGPVGALVVLCVSSWLAGGWATMFLLALASLPLLWRRRDGLPARFAAAWLLAFVALTPVYRPYARLFLPLTLVLCLLAGLTLSGLAERVRSSRGGMRGSIACAAAAALVWFLAARGHQTSDPWRSSRGMAEAASAMSEVIPAGSRVKVIEEPTLAYYLYRLGFDSLRGVENVVIPAGEPREIYVVMGYYGRISALEPLGDRIEPLGVYPIRVKDLRLTDDMDPPYTGFTQRDGPHDLRLFRVKPGGGMGR